MLSPTCAANRLLAQLVGCRVHEAALAPDDGATRAIAGADAAGTLAIVIVRRSAEPATLRLSGLRILRAQALTADGLDAALPGRHRVGPVRPVGWRRAKIDLPPWSVTAIIAKPG